MRCCSEGKELIMEGQKEIRKAPKVNQSGKRVRLREDAFKHVKKREWIFTRIEKEKRSC
jgi:hypothetical protein